VIIKEQRMPIAPNFNEESKLFVHNRFIDIEDQALKGKVILGISHFLH